MDKDRAFADWGKADVFVVGKGESECNWREKEREDRWVYLFPLRNLEKIKK